MSHRHPDPTAAVSLPARSLLFMVQCALQASATLASAQKRVDQLAAVVATLVAAPPALRAAVDALHGTLSQPAEEAVPDRAHL